MREGCHYRTDIAFRERPATSLPQKRAGCPCPSQCSAGAHPLPPPSTRTVRLTQVSEISLTSNPLTPCTRETELPSTPESSTRTVRSPMSCRNHESATHRHGVLAPMASDFVVASANPSIPCRLPRAPLLRFPNNTCMAPIRRICHRSPRLYPPCWSAPRWLSSPVPTPNRASGAVVPSQRRARASEARGGPAS